MDTEPVDNAFNHTTNSQIAGKALSDISNTIGFKLIFFIFALTMFILSDFYKSYLRSWSGTIDELGEMSVKGELVTSTVMVIGYVMAVYLIKSDLL